MPEIWRFAHLLFETWLPAPYVVSCLCLPAPYVASCLCLPAPYVVYCLCFLFCHSWSCGRSSSMSSSVRSRNYSRRWRVSKSHIIRSCIQSFTLKCRQWWLDHILVESRLVADRMALLLSDGKVTFAVVPASCEIAHESYCFRDCWNEPSALHSRIW